MAEQNPVSPRAFFRIEILLALLAALSVLLIVFPQSWFTWQREVLALHYPASITADHSTGGNSTVSWVDEEQDQWKCETGTNFPVYCSYTLDLRTPEGSGLNLDNFYKMQVWLNYKGPAKSVRVMLRNAAPPYFVENQNTTTKYNLVEIPVEKLKDGIEIDSHAFVVADWWLATNKVGPKSAHPEFQNVYFLEIQTGEVGYNEEHIFQLEKASFQGYYFTSETIYRGLILGWSALILILLCYRVTRLKFKLSRDKKHQAELLELNHILEIQNKEFAEIARTDQLTGLRNRLGIRDALYENMKIWKESRTPFSLILMDIDHFKQVNDRYGHETGDNILRAVANMLLKSTRRTDCLARWGGEEFVLICRDTNVERARAVAEHLREKLEQANIHPKFKITASFGVASLSKADVNDLFKRADQVLYEAKTQGRNCVRVNTEGFTDAFAESTRA